ncbi:hypothetical protein HMI56_001371 [Coelomomyces lativittatus]|nr:hypothetical protein HMI56_001371 [Coelomomyces lativittatus]
MTEAKLTALEQEKQQLIKLHQSDMEEKIQNQEQEREQCQLRILKLTNDLNELADFRGRKELMEKEVGAMALELENKEKEFKNELTTMERKHLQDKHALRKEMFGKVTEAVTTFRHAADIQMAETTKKVIKENLIVTAQLRKMATKTTDLLVENELLKNINSKLRLDKESFEDMQKELIVKNLSLEQVVRKLIQKFNSQIDSNKSSIKSSHASLTSSNPSIQGPNILTNQCRSKSPSPLRQANPIPLDRDDRLFIILSQFIQQAYVKQGFNLLPEDGTDFPYVHRFLNDLKSQRCILTWRSSVDLSKRNSNKQSQPKFNSTLKSKLKENKVTSSSPNSFKNQKKTIQEVQFPKKTSIDLQRGPDTSSPIKKIYPYIFSPNTVDSI